MKMRLKHCVNWILPIARQIALLDHIEWCIGHPPPRWKHLGHLL